MVLHLYLVYLLVLYNKMLLQQIIIFILSSIIGCFRHYIVMFNEHVGRAQPECWLPPLLDLPT